MNFKNKKLILEMQEHKYIFNSISKLSDFLDLNYKLLLEMLDGKLELPGIKIYYLDMSDGDLNKYIDEGYMIITKY